MFKSLAQMQHRFIQRGVVHSGWDMQVLLKPPKYFDEDVFFSLFLTSRVSARVERFDRRPIEPFELFISEFGQNSVRIQEIFFFKQKTAYEMLRSLVGSEMCIRDRPKGIPFANISNFRNFLKILDEFS